MAVASEGIIYRPLTGDGSAPPSWSSGQVCWQNMTAVGTNGASIIYEIDQAACIDMDSSWALLAPRGAPRAAA